MSVYNGYNIGRGAIYSWSITPEMEAQGYSATPSYLVETLKDSFEVWDNGVNFNFLGTSLDYATVHVGVKYIDGPGGTRGMTVFNDPDGDKNIGENDDGAVIYIDQADIGNFEEILMHEIGHVVGLADSSDPSSIMYSALDGDPTLSATDTTNLKALYGETPDPLAGAIRGSTGPDRIGATDGNDTVYSNDGNDVISGYRGTDYLFGQSGDDLIYGNQEIDYISGGAGNDTLYGGQNSGTAKADAYGNMRQQDGTESIRGGSGDDLIYGNYGNDDISGNSGNDTIFAGQNNDTVDGGSGDDLLFGNRGSDRLEGGTGADTFVFGSYDQGGDSIWDFNGAEGDRIDLTGSYTFHDAGSSVLINHDGGQIQLSGITLSQFDAGWII